MPVLSLSYFRWKAKLEHQLELRMLTAEIEIKSDVNSVNNPVLSGALSNEDRMILVEWGTNFDTFCSTYIQLLRFYIVTWYNLQSSLCCDAS